AVMWLSMLMASTLMLVPAISLSATTVAYGIAIIKKDAPANPIKEPNVGKLAAKAAVANATTVKSARAAV
ncbi:UNVERIFIED_CONTAM: hypothetical protein HDU68_005219, partial [Siphonaria sp. JEL0065]